MRPRSLSVIAVIALVAGCASGPASPSGASAVVPTTVASTAATPPASTSPKSSATPVATQAIGGTTQDVEVAGAKRIGQGDGPDWVTMAAGSAWVATGVGIQQYDGATGAPGSRVPVFGVCLAMDTGFASLWVGDCDAHALVRVDPATARITSTIVLPVDGIQEESSIAAGEGAVWVVSTAASLVKVDPTSGKVVGQSDLPPGAAAARAGLGSVWVTVSAGNSLLRIDPADGTVRATIPVGRYPRFLAVGADAVWVMDQADGAVTRVDRTGKVVATIKVSPDPIDGGDIAVGGGFVWVRISSALVAKVDPATNAVVATYGPPSGSGGVAADASAAWITAHDVSAVWRLPLE